MNKYVLALSFLLFSGISIHAQPDSVKSYLFPVIVDSIIISGNDITEEEIILRELTFSPGDTLTEKLAYYNKERIFSLGIFTKVEIYPLTGKLKDNIIIHVEESWYIYPIPFVQLKNKDWDKLSYGFYAVVKNFRGRNETITGKAAFGYDPSFTLSYYKPSVTRGSNIFFQADVAYTNIKNISTTAEKLYGNEFDQKLISGQVTTGKRFGLFNWLSLSLAYNYIEMPFFIKGVSASDSRIDRFPSVGVSYMFDDRDLIQFPKNGLFFDIDWIWKGFGINDANYGILNLDFREYRSLWRELHGKWRFASRFTMGKMIPFYDYSYLGYAEKIRGHFNDQEEGNHFYLSSLELYHPIIKDMNISFEWVPLIPDQLLRYRIALYGQLFVDTGAVQQRNKKLGLNNFNTGFGAGLTFLVLPYNLLRIEYALDEFNNSEFILDLGVSF
jgi:outer membrane protein assembly factor BamA